MSQIKDFLIYGKRNIQTLFSSELYLSTTKRSSWLTLWGPSYSDGNSTWDLNGVLSWPWVKYLHTTALLQSSWHISGSGFFYFLPLHNNAGFAGWLPAYFIMIPSLLWGMETPRWLDSLLLGRCTSEIKSVKAATFKQHSHVFLVLITIRILYNKDLLLASRLICLDTVLRKQLQAALIF